VGLKSFLFLSGVIVLGALWYQLSMKSPPSIGQESPSFTRSESSNSPLLYKTQDKRTAASTRPAMSNNKPPLDASRKINLSRFATEKDLSKERRKITESIEMWRSFASGTSFEQAGRHFDVLSLRAFPKEQFLPEMGEVISEKDGMVYFVSHQERSDLYPVILKSSNGQVGFLSGVVMASVESLDDAEALAKDYQMQMNTYDADLKRAYFKTPNVSDVLVVLNQLRQAVSSVEVEVVLGYKRN